MNNPSLVGGFERVGDLSGNGKRFVERDGSLGNAIGQRRSFNEFEHERPDAISVLEPVDVPDVRVVQRSEDPGFTFEAGEAVGILRKRVRQIG